MRPPDRADDRTELVLCAGPPACLFKDQAAIDNANDGCPLCRHIIVHGDGSETEFKIEAN